MGNEYNKEYNKEYTIILNKEEYLQIAGLVKQITECPSKDPSGFTARAKQLASCLPNRIIQILTCFSLHGNSRGYLLLSRFVPEKEEEEEIPDTPPDNTHHIGETTRLAKAQAILNECIGNMIAYEAEGDGNLFQDMSPNYKMSKMQTSLGSAVELEIHTEQAFSNLRPDFLSLACLRGDPNATTFILPVNTILDHISLSEKELLLEPLWKIGVDLSFKLNGAEFIEGDLRGPIPILTSDGYLVFDQDLMRGITEEAEQLRKKIIQIYYEHRTGHCLRPGEIIWIDNRRALHGRSSFSPKFDGKDRFLVRTFITLDLEKSAYARGKEKEERMVRAIYS